MSRNAAPVAEIVAGLDPPAGLAEAEARLEELVARQHDLAERRGAVQQTGALRPDLTFTGRFSLAEQRALRSQAARTNAELGEVEVEIGIARKWVQALRDRHRNALAAALADRRTEAVAQLRAAYVAMTRALNMIEEIDRAVAGDIRRPPGADRRQVDLLLGAMIQRVGGIDAAA